MISTSNGDRVVAEVVSAVRAKEFALVRRGYDMDQVKAYLSELAGGLEQLDEQRQEARREADELRAELGRARETSESFADPFDEAGTRVSEILRSVSAEADVIRRQASEAADHAKREARAQANALLTEAMDELAAGRDLLLQEMEAANRRVADIMDRLRNALPDEESRVPHSDPEPEVVRSSNGQSASEEPAPAEEHVPVEEPSAPYEPARHQEEPAPRRESVFDNGGEGGDESSVASYLELFASETEN